MGSIKGMRILAAGFGALLLAAAAPPDPAPTDPATPALTCRGVFAQGGFVLCRTNAGARLVIDNAVETEADEAGLAVVGFDRDAPGETVIEAFSGAAVARRIYPIARRNYDVQRIDNLPQAQVSPTDPALLARIAAESARKQVGFASRADLEAFASDWIWPLADGFRLTGAWGGQRILNGEAKTPHYGVDLAAAKGTLIRAPADGVVSFAETGLHYEGGLVLIDHGQGLVSAYLHMSRVDVVLGERIKQGGPIGLVGAEGRATGPHLCWRLKWRGRNLDPSLAIPSVAAGLVPTTAP